MMQEQQGPQLQAPSEQFRFGQQPGSSEFRFAPLSVQEPRRRYG
jgi:hypothetical protein